MASTDEPVADRGATVTEVFESVAAAAPEIRAGLPGRRAKDATENPSGEQQMAADVYADDLLLDRMRGIDGVGTYASEERAETVDVADGAGDGRDTGEGDAGLSVAIDPLDGSSNLRPNNLMGTIVAVYDAPLPATGDDIVAAGYVLYGPITNMVVARGETVTEYLIDDGERRVLNEDLALPEDPLIYGFGGRVNDWFEDYEAYVREVEREEGMKLRYGGSMIGDVNQVLTYGGVFSYPASKDAHRGKLRMQFEGYPVGYIVETAGGRSSDGEQSLLDLNDPDLHARTPVHVGNEELIQRLEAALA